MKQKNSKTEIMPVLFVGYGSPMNGIEDNEFSRGWREVGKALPEPKAILCISAHWETRGTLVTIMPKPRIIYDFYGFPEKLYKVKYPAFGSVWLAWETKKGITKAVVDFDEEWGLDHGCWIVLKQMFPDASIPIVQMSLDYTKPAQSTTTSQRSLSHSGERAFSL